jgi:hypothetical protein
VRFVDDNEVWGSDRIQPARKGLNRGDHGRLLSHEFARLDESVRYADALQCGTDLLEDFFPVRDDDHPGPAFQDLLGDVREEHRLAGSSGADGDRPLGAGRERGSDVVRQLVLVRSKFHREP